MTLKIAQKTLTKKFFLLLIALVLVNILYQVAANFESNKSSLKKTKLAQKPNPSLVLKEKHVIADFYYWYDLPNGVHSTSLTDTPKYTATSYKNPDWFYKQLTDMKEAGIDILLVVYWSKYEPAYLEGLKNLNTGREMLLKQSKNAPTIGLFLDTGIFDRMPKEDKNLLSDSGKERFYQIIKEFFDNIPKKNWALINGKPVIWLWGNYFNIYFDQSSFDYIYNRFNEDFGTKPYIVREESWNYPLKKGLFIPTKYDFTKPIVTDDVYKWGAELNGFSEAGGNVASVGPGYDERLLGGTSDRTDRHADRNGGKWYEDNFQKAINSGKNLINIETWNEFHEASDIADSVQYGRNYINITKTYTTKFLSK